MLIDEVVEYCHNDYIHRSCRDCAKNCSRDCKKCLDDLHFHQNHIRNDYDCERLLNYYVCRYSYKYCSEIIYALESVKLSSYPYFHILSLGCGGAPDLMAFDYMGYSQPISYIGIDKNIYWKNIHDKIKDRAHINKVQFFRNVDVLNDYEKYALRDTNVLVIEYLISFFYSHIGDDGVKEWFGELVENIILKKSAKSPLLIMINDVDSRNTGRDTFPYLRTEIEKRGMTVTYEYRKRFNACSYYENSEIYPEKSNKFDLQSFVKDNYCPAINCTSVQLILEVT